MNYLKDADERLLTELESKKLIIKEQQSKIRQLEQQTKKRSNQISNLSQQNEYLNEKHANQMVQANVIYLRQNDSKSVLEAEIKELRETIVYYKNKIQTSQKAREEEVLNLRIQIELNKSDYTSKMRNLEQNLALLKKTFSVEEMIEKDRQQTIKDSSKDKDGSTRGVILHSKQLAIQLENQSEQIVIMLQKIERTNEQITRLKREVDIQKEVEVGLVKRSTTAQNLVRQLNQRNKELEIQNQSLRKREDVESKVSRPTPSIQNHNTNGEILSIKTQLNISNMENSKLRNEINYLQNKIRLHETKFQGLATILSQHLQNILIANNNPGPFSQQNNQQPLQINLSDLRNKDIVEWKPEETATIVYLLLAQIKSIISKKNLISLPDLKNPNVSIVDEAVSKQTINLPKISTQYNQMINNMQQKKPSRFKGIPLDISTKIVRSELRNWGVKVGLQKKNNKSLSMYSKNNVSFL